MSAFPSGWPTGPALLSAASALLLFAILYAYFGYPLIVRTIVGRVRGLGASRDVESWPSLSVLIAAHNEIRLGPNGGEDIESSEEGMVLV